MAVSRRRCCTHLYGWNRLKSGWVVADNAGCHTGIPHHDVPTDVLCRRRFRTLPTLVVCFFGHTAATALQLHKTALLSVIAIWLQADMKERMRRFCEARPRPFHVKYDPFSRSVSVDRAITRMPYTSGTAVY